MSWVERATIVGNMKYVVDVLPMKDDDDTACDGIQSAYAKYKKKYDMIYFGNGGAEAAMLDAQAVFHQQDLRGPILQRRSLQRTPGYRIRPRADEPPMLRDRFHLRPCPQPLGVLRLIAVGKGAGVGIDDGGPARLDDARKRPGFGMGDVDQDAPLVHPFHHLHAEGR